MTSEVPAQDATQDAAPAGPGPLRNGNPRGNPNLAPRCGAKARTTGGQPCQAPAMKNGRCRMHGGTATGPRTPEGRARMRAAHLKNGLHTKEAIALRRCLRAEIRTLRAALRAVVGTVRARALLLLARGGAHPTEATARHPVPAANAPKPQNPAPCENTPRTVSDPDT